MPYHAMKLTFVVYEERMTFSTGLSVHVIPIILPVILLLQNSICTIPFTIHQLRQTLSYVK
jgi:hypothetical protein